MIDNIDFLALIVSTIAIFVSIWSQMQNKKLSKETIAIAKKDLNRKFFEEIFFDYLTKDLPEEIEKLEDINYLIENGTDKAIDILINLLVKSNFYKFFDNDFFNKIIISVSEIEDVLSNIDNCILRIKDSKAKKDINKENENEIELRNLRNIDLKVKLDNLYNTFKIYYSGY